MTDFKAILDRLEAWTPQGADYRADRETADMVLRADGWSRVTDPDFEGGIVWTRGVNPQVFASDGSRPHPLNDLNAAVALVPRNCSFRVTRSSDGRCFAEVWAGRGPVIRIHSGTSAEIAVAVTTAALKAMAYQREKAYD